MTKRIFSNPSFTPTAQADGTLTSSTYMAIKGGSSTMQVTIYEVFETGQASSTGYNAMCLAYASTLETTPTALALPVTTGYVNPNGGALSITEVAFTAASTGPARSPATTLPRLRLGFNPYGGIVRWTPAPSTEWTQFGNSTNGGETLLSAENYGTAAAMAANIVYEVV